MTENSTVVGKELQYPPNWNVVLWNDDFTPMGFMIYLLKEIFRYEDSDAFNLMMEIHKNGRAVAGTYLRSVAESKMNLAAETAENSGYPLRITVEKE